jgi:hypothetical protein
VTGEVVSTLEAGDCSIGTEFPTTALAVMSPVVDVLVLSVGADTGCEVVSTHPVKVPADKGRYGNTWDDHRELLPERSTGCEVVSTHHGGLDVLEQPVSDSMVQLPGMDVEVTRAEDCFGIGGVSVQGKVVSTPGTEMPPSTVPSPPSSVALAHVVMHGGSTGGWNGTFGSEVVSTLPEVQLHPQIPNLPPTGTVMEGGSMSGWNGTVGGEVVSTLPEVQLQPQVPSPTSAGVLTEGGSMSEWNGTAGSEVVSTLPEVQLHPQTPSSPSDSPMDTASPQSYSVITSPYPELVQADIVLNGKPNRTRIQDRVDRLKSEYGISPGPLQRAPLHGNILIPVPNNITKQPFWGFRASGILPQHLMDGVIEAMAEAEAAGCHPNINPLKKAAARAKRREREGLSPTSTGGARSDYEVPFHIGVFKHPSRVFDQPWITKDTLQGLSGDGKTREMRIGKMMALCKSLDNLVNGRVQRLLAKVTPQTLVKFRQFARLRASSDQIIQHDIHDRPLPAALERFDTRWPFLRFGNLGTTVAIGRGQSEKLHLDVHDDEELPTILMVLGREGQDWDHSDRQGDIMLPTLGLSIPLYPGDIFIFYASLIPHQVKLLPEAERHKRTVATLFTCTTTKKFLQGKHKQLDEVNGDNGIEPHGKRRRLDGGASADDVSG